MHIYIYRELDRIRYDSHVKTELQVEIERLEETKIKEDKEMIANNRKNRMRELEKKSLLASKKTDSDMIRIGKDQVRGVRVVMCNFI